TATYLYLRVAPVYVSSIMPLLHQYCLYIVYSLFFFFFNDTATTEIYTLSLHDALPISFSRRGRDGGRLIRETDRRRIQVRRSMRSEEHTSELQSLAYLVCRLLLEKKNKQ